MPSHLDLMIHRTVQVDRVRVGNRRVLRTSYGKRNTGIVVDGLQSYKQAVDQRGSQERLPIWMYYPEGDFPGGPGNTNWHCAIEVAYFRLDYIAHAIGKTQVWAVSVAGPDSRRLIANRRPAGIVPNTRLPGIARDVILQRLSVLRLSRRREVQLIVAAVLDGMVLGK